MENKKLTLTIAETALRLGISRGLAYELARQGKLPGVIHLGDRRMVVSKAKIDALLTGNGSQNEKGA